MGGAVREYTVIRSRRRTMALQVTRDAQVVVRAPVHAPQQEIHRFVAEHEDWLRKQIARQEQRLSSHPPRSREEQETLRQKAKEMLPPLVRQWARQIGVEPAGVRITSARTRFGSCSGKNSLCFSLYLMEYPPDAIEAVVVHELAHIRHKNHGPGFYALIRQVMPDYDARIKTLRQ